MKHYHLPAGTPCAVRRAGTSAWTSHVTTKRLMCPLNRGIVPGVNVIIKVEVSDQGVNTRLVVTDREPARTQGLSQHMYGARGQAENESKAHKRSLQAARTSCHRLAANQLRVF